MINESSQSVLANKIRDDISGPLQSVRCPNGGYVVVFNHFCALYVHEKICLKCGRRFCVPQWEFPPHIDLVWEFRAMYA